MEPGRLLLLKQHWDRFHGIMMLATNTSKQSKSRSINMCAFTKEQQHESILVFSKNQKLNAGKYGYRNDRTKSNINIPPSRLQYTTS